jgi:hypothetical protein
MCWLCEDGGTARGVMGKRAIGCVACVLFSGTEACKNEMGYCVKAGGQLRDNKYSVRVDWHCSFCFLPKVRI